MPFEKPKLEEGQVLFEMLATPINPSQDFENEVAETYHKHMQRIFDSLHKNKKK